MQFDFVSAAIGFLLGAFTGAAGTYYGYLFTDRRREQEARKAERKLFKSIEQQMPELIAEFCRDLESHPLVRKFFVMPSRNDPFGGSDELHFIYYEDEHTDLRSKLAILENHGYVIDVTPKNTPMYRMSEGFVAAVMGVI